MRRSWDIVRMALGSLRANLLRSLLTTLGIVIGITTIIAIVSIIEGLNDTVAGELEAFGQGVLYIQKFPWASNDWQKFRSYPEIAWPEYNVIAAEARTIAGLSPIKYTSKQVKWRNRKLDSIEVNGVNEQYAMIRGAFPALGRFFAPFDIASGRSVCILGFKVAEELFGVRDPIGKRIRVGKNSFEVIGVIGERGDFFDQNLDNFVLLPHTTFSKTMESWRRGFTIVVKARDTSPAGMAATRDELRSLLRRVRKVPLSKGDNFSVNQIDVLRDLYKKLTGGLYAAMFAVAGISLLVGGIGIMNIMLVSVTERTREIGVRKALGAKRRAILAQFLIEAVVISSLGGVIGVGGGALIARLVASVTPLPASVKLWSVLVGIGFSGVVGIFFGIFPARAAAKKDPIEALRYE